MRTLFLLGIFALFGCSKPSKNAVAKDSHTPAVEIATPCKHDDCKIGSLPPSGNHTSLTEPEPGVPAEPAWAAKLRAEAAKRHLNFRVYCFGDDFYGVAWQYGLDETSAQIKEKGGLGKWISKGETQQAAGDELRIAIQRRSGSDWFPSESEHKEPSPSHHRICPPEISGGESQP